MLHPGFGPGLMLSLEKGWRDEWGWESRGSGPNPTGLGRFCVELSPGHRASEGHRGGGKLGVLGGFCGRTSHLNATGRALGAELAAPLGQGEAMKASELCAGQQTPPFSTSSHRSGSAGIPRIPGHLHADEPRPHPGGRSVPEPVQEPAGCSIPARQHRPRAPSSAPTNLPPTLIPGGFEARPDT